MDGEDWYEGDSANGNIAQKEVDVQEKIRDGTRHGVKGLVRQSRRKGHRVQDLCSYWYSIKHCSGIFGT